MGTKVALEESMRETIILPGEVVITINIHVHVYNYKLNFGFMLSRVTFKSLKYIANVPAII